MILSDWTIFHYMVLLSIESLKNQFSIEPNIVTFTVQDDRMRHFFVLYMNLFLLFRTLTKMGKPLLRRINFFSVDYNKLKKLARGGLQS